MVSCEGNPEDTTMTDAQIPDQPDHSTSEDNAPLVVEFGARGAKATVPPKLFAEIGPVLKWSVLLFSFAGAIAMILGAISLVVRAWK